MSIWVEGFIGTAKVFKGYRMYVPKSLRRELNLKPGDVLVFYKREDYIVVAKVARISQRTI
jgi:AbrB family looped-hinge helix DNA binding protein